MRDLIDIVSLMEKAAMADVNSLGRPIGPPEAVKAFWNWFGNSKTVDRQGRPLVLFHGTKATGFRKFDASLSGTNTQWHDLIPQGAFFFTNSPATAASYANQTTHDWGFPTERLRDEYRKIGVEHGWFSPEAKEFFDNHAVQFQKTYGEGGNIMPVYLKMIRPLKVDGKGEAWNNIWYKDDDWTVNDLCFLAIEKGYDGLIVRRIHDRNEGHGEVADTYVVFSAAQIKSATGNKGAYDPQSEFIDEDGEDA